MLTALQEAMPSTPWAAGTFGNMCQFRGQGTVREGNQESDKVPGNFQAVLKKRELLPWLMEFPVSHSQLDKSTIILKHLYCPLWMMIKCNY